MSAWLKCVAAGACVLLFWPAPGRAQEKETPSARATRKKLQQKISVEWENTPLKVAVDELKAEFDNRLGVKIDNTAGVSNNTKVTYKADNVALKKILDDLCTKYDWGYVVLSRKNDRYDGWIIIRKSAERGYEKGKEPKAGESSRSALPPARRPTARLHRGEGRPVWLAAAPRSARRS